MTTYIGASILSSTATSTTAHMESFCRLSLILAKRMLKPRFVLDALSEDSEDIYLQTKLETYLKRPTQLDSLTYPEFYRWWRSATVDEQRKVARATSRYISDSEWF